jgi:hypothetical protein
MQSARVVNAPKHLDAPPSNLPPLLVHKHLSDPLQSIACTSGCNPWVSTQAGAHKKKLITYPFIYPCATPPTCQQIAPATMRHRLC